MTETPTEDSQWIGEIVAQVMSQIDDIPNTNDLRSRVALVCGLAQGYAARVSTLEDKLHAIATQLGP